jgi:hypothetical protein
VARFSSVQRYTKWRLVKLPAKGRYKGATHEVYSNGGTFETIFSWPFVELAKTPEEIRQKALRDVAILERVTKEEPGEARVQFIALTFQPAQRRRAGSIQIVFDQQVRRHA